MRNGTTTPRNGAVAVESTQCPPPPAETMSRLKSDPPLKNDNRVQLKPSLGLYIPKTGTSFVNHFFECADLLELKRLCGLNHLTIPSITSISIMNRAKKLPFFYYGHLRPKLKTHHVEYSNLPHNLRKYPKICILRDIKDWHASFYSFYLKCCRFFPNFLLCKVIRTLIQNDSRKLIYKNKDVSHVLPEYKEAFIDKFNNEDMTPDSVQNMSPKFSLWFHDTIRMEAMASWLGIHSLPKRKIGHLTFKAITFLLDNPQKIFCMDQKEFDDYFASGEYHQDIKCDFFLNFNELREQLCSLMVDELGYDQEIILFLKEHLPRQNFSPSKPHIMKFMQEVSEHELHDEIYQEYFLPLREI